jgi:hypothetical protein
MLKKKKKKKQLISKVWDIVGYYVDDKGSQTIVADKKDPRKTKMIKGIA